MITFTPLGGANEIGANAYYLNIDETGILIDCGMHPRNKGLKALPNFDYLNDKPLDYVIISHAHSDHIGSLPYLIKLFPHVKILMTTQTKQIAGITLHNSANILRETLNDEPGIEPYTHEEIDLLTKTIFNYSYNETFEISGILHRGNSAIHTTFYDAGHILGSAGILFEYEHERIFYTGDTRKSKQIILNGANYPKQRVTALIMESTYGAADQKNSKTWFDEFEKFSKKANRILEGGGSILIPIFALGKTQEMLAGINHFIEKGKLLNPIIYSGGIANRIANVYDDNKYLVERNLKNLDLRKIEQVNIYGITNKNDFFKNNGIVLAPGGMLDERTFSYKMVRDFLKNDKSSIFIVGYIDPDSPGAVLLKAKKGDKIKLAEHEKPFEIKCTIEKFNFPSHSTKEELLEMVYKLNPARVILVHGDEQAISSLGYKILKLFDGVKLHSCETEKTIIISE
ncbi:MAG: MBL fold metallo-hydrolase [Ignavibacteriae bacterium]|nr:MBL fold metallo-hydrolase [Ignavibacteriota bacterium]NOG99015.1 MBL fold metallo-hydrolase [Ignavibacteriota bacterium]